MKKFAFVILNYNTFEETKKCVESIKRIKNFDKVGIIVVDNGSQDKSGEKLKDLFYNDTSIKVILSDENLGFARGNNLGFKYAKDKLKSEYIILCNSDTTILTNNILEIIEEDFSKYNFAVLGPKIHLPNGKFENVGPDQGIITIKHQRELLRKVKIKYYIKKFFHISHFWKLSEKKDKIGTKKEEKNNGYTQRVDEKVENVVLNGCFLIFSTIYIQKFEGLNDRSFLYGEEGLLSIRLMQNNMSSFYEPDIEIYHCVSSALNNTNKDEHKKQVFILKQCINTLEISIDELKKKNVI